MREKLEKLLTENYCNLEIRTLGDGKRIDSYRIEFYEKVDLSEIEKAAPADSQISLYPGADGEFTITISLGDRE